MFVLLGGGIGWGGTAAEIERVGGCRPKNQPKGSNGGWV